MQHEHSLKHGWVRLGIMIYAYFFPLEVSKQIGFNGLAWKWYNFAWPKTYIDMENENNGLT